MLITGLSIHHAYAADLASCTPHDCGETLDQFERSHDVALRLIELLVIIVPDLIGIFWGAPLIGRELETGKDIQRTPGYLRAATRRFGRTLRRYRLGSHCEPGQVTRSRAVAIIIQPRRARKPDRAPVACAPVVR